jgi:hypothetical protein
MHACSRGPSIAARAAKGMTKSLAVARGVEIRAKGPNHPGARDVEVRAKGPNHPDAKHLKFHFAKWQFYNRDPTILFCFVTDDNKARMLGKIFFIFCLPEVTTFIKFSHNTLRFAAQTPPRRTLDLRVLAGNARKQDQDCGVDLSFFPPLAEKCALFVSYFLTGNCR